MSFLIQQITHSQQILRERLNLLTSYVDPPSYENPPHRKVLVVHCHPNPDSYSTKLADAVVRGLGEAGHEIILRRLYFHKNKNECYNGKSFSPSLTLEEIVDYNNKKNTENIEKRNRFLTEDIAEAVKDLRWCNAIVFVYPTWWFNFPASLKGYFDRVFLPGVAFKLTKSLSSQGSTGLQSCLTHINKIGVVTTYGATENVVFFAGDNSRNAISRGIRPLCAPNCTLLWLGLYDYDNATIDKKESHLKKVQSIYSKF